MKPHTRLSSGILAAGILALLTAIPVWAQINSHARIVRLSFVEGNVTVQRPDVQAWADAPVNTPLQQGFRLSTGENSFAEIQFENGGTIRLGQLALLDFAELALASDGSKINQVEPPAGIRHLSPAGLSARGIPASGDAVRKTPRPGRHGVPCRLGPGRRAGGSPPWHGGSAKHRVMTIENDFVLELQPGASEPSFPGHHQR